LSATNACPALVAEQPPPQPLPPLPAVRCHARVLPPFLVPMMAPHEETIQPDLPTDLHDSQVLPTQEDGRILFATRTRVLPPSVVLWIPPEPGAQHTEPESASTR
jgi:hypothetical protein